MYNWEIIAGLVVEFGVLGCCVWIEELFFDSKG